MADGELHNLIEDLEAEIEELGAIAEGCRKWILLSKAAIGLGALWLMAYVMGLVWSDPTLMVFAIAAVLGGIVLAGSNDSTLRRTRAALKHAEALKRRMIDEAGLTRVEGPLEPRRIE
jgi:hypothetical protein